MRAHLAARREPAGNQNKATKCAICLHTPRNEVEGGILGSSVRLSVRPSAVSVWTITWILFIGFHFFLYMYHLVKILDGIEHEHRTSLNMHIMAGHVT